MDPPPQWEDAGLNDTQVLVVSIPPGEDEGEWDQCEMYNTSDVEWSEGGYNDWVGETRTQHTCTDGWWYSQQYYGSTIVGEVSG